MRQRRLGLALLAVYLSFIGGAYYNTIFPVRFFHHFIITVLLAVWLGRRLRRGQGLPHTSINRPLYALVGFWIISAALSIDPRIAFENLWFPIVHILMFFVIADWMQHGRQRLVIEIQFLLAALAVILGGLQLASWFLGLGIVPGTQVGWIDVIGDGLLFPPKIPGIWLPLGVTTWMAGYTAPLVIIAGVWGGTVKQHDYRIVLRGLAVALFIIMIFTFSRGGLISLGAGFAVLIWFRVLRIDVVRRFNLSRVLLVGGTVAGMVIVVAFVVVSMSQSNAKVVGDARRIDMWVSAAEMARDNPVSGIGPGLFGRAYRDYRNPSIVDDRMATAHNVYLNTVAETGFIGAVLGLWLLLALVRAWWGQWSRAEDAMYKFRLEATFAALVGFGAQSLVDVFVATPLVLLAIILIAYSIIDQSAPDDDTNSRRVNRLETGIALGIVLIYGLGFIQADRAQLSHQRSIRGGDTALQDAQRAAELDPDLRLYQLNVFYLSAQQALAQSPQDIDAAIQYYEQALELEPTWDTGWINYAALLQWDGNISGALNALETAHRINHQNTARLHWARLAEEMDAASRDDIVDAYVEALVDSGHIPFADFWSQTELRREALFRAIEEYNVEVRYRVMTIHDPESRMMLLAESPHTAAEWWVDGEYALRVEHDLQRAINSFTQAIEQQPGNGDYYASRARAELTIDADAARRDLLRAELLGTRWEYPNAIRIALATTSEEIRDLQVHALPPRVADLNFSGVLFAGRVAQFELFPEMRWPGPGSAALQPWYDLADNYLDDGRVQNAVQVYQAILDYAPFEDAARVRLDELGLAA
ncbi:MAG: hypothetical protein CUN54_03215 [Phototrophicales bacterium]|nr:MAG: hypothetical protein CUN54_03215 [Phototrophicales bacterium]